MVVSGRIGGNVAGGLCSVIFGATIMDVALSDEENRILREIEAQLENDPKFAKAVSAGGMYRAPARKMWWALVGVVVFLIAMVVSLQVHFLAAFVWFVGMLGCALVIEREARAMGRTGMKDIAETLRRASVTPGKIRGRGEDS